MKKLIQNRVIHHTLFWGITYWVLLSIFTEGIKASKIEYIYTGIFIFPLLFGVYINLLLLIPKLLYRKYYFLYTSTVTLGILISSKMNLLLFEKYIDQFLPGYYFISYYELDDICLFSLTLIVLTTLLKLSKERFLLQEEKQKVVSLEKEKAEAELKLLSNQLNPHFLFNSLNVLYSLAINKKEETPHAIIQLSDTLRYVIYEANQEMVPLEAEIALINNYIELQKYRTGSKAKIDFKEEVEYPETKIAPMLLLPLVENSFKHGIKGDLENTFLKASLKANEKKVEFRIQNNKGISQEIKKHQNGGLGLKSIKKRLQLIYPDNHQFETSEDHHSFSVKLSITV
ncbi:sensor histidine kinase [Xanthovirga aplysinae]|uniref:sensor histidine kinase n=1 Tax=Xanthovirga aplysinae TaxID=2529853 RepID=UPI001CA3DFE5|nr:histidine kinase [Xanthovirga aplysinae]